MDASEREEWSAKLEETLLIGGASFSEWANLVAYEAYTCFIAGADVATIVMCASCVEAYLRSEADDHSLKFYDAIEASLISDELKAASHALRNARNDWLHLSRSRAATDLPSYELAYNEDLENAAKQAYTTMLRILFSNPWI